jgi:glucosyl-dolichyl phosphate glucuronosyltransferase
VNPTRISVILATKDRSHILDKTLESFSKLCVDDLTVNYIVVDNGSCDDTQRVIRKWQAVLPIRSWIEPVLGKNRCLNQAVSEAEGELLVFTDDDILADHGWLQAYDSAACRWPDVNIFGGKIDPQFPKVIGTEFFVKEKHYGILFSRYHPADKESKVKKAPFGPNMMIRRNVFDSYRYDESIGPAGSEYPMGSETELLLRLSKSGMSFVYVPSASVRHLVREEQLDRRWLLARAKNSGRGMARLNKPRGRRVFGIPWRLLRNWLGAHVLHLIASLRNQQTEAFWQQWAREKYRAAWIEYRSMLASATRDDRGTI